MEISATEKYIKFRSEKKMVKNWLQGYEFHHIPPCTFFFLFFYLYLWQQNLDNKFGFFWLERKEKNPWPILILTHYPNLAQPTSPLDK